jgi:hypothetical protein
MSVKNLTYGMVSLAALCAVLMLTPLGAVAQQGIRDIQISGDHLTSTQAIEVATESSATSLDNIEATLSADATHDNAAIATGPQLMAVGKSTAPTAVGDESDAVRIWADLTGRLQINTSQINGVAPTMGNGASGTGVQRVTLASDSTGQVALAAGTAYAGKVRATDGTNDSVLDPCKTVAKSFVAIDQTSGEELVAAGTNSFYICSINLVTATAQNIALVSGTGSVCATSTGGMAGGTTAATGWNFAANGGLTQGNGDAAIFKTTAAARAMCLLQSGAGQISGTITYVER